MRVCLHAWCVCVWAHVFVCFFWGGWDPFIQIMLAQFGRVPVQELIAGVLRMDEGVLGRDPLSSVEALMKNMPTDEEAATLKAYSGPKDCLGK